MKAQAIGCLLLLVLANLLVISANTCLSGNIRQIQGNWYCDEVAAIQYSNLGKAGSYNEVTSMELIDGNCSSVPKPYSGSLSPFDEELSLHFRGPIQVKQVAAYNLVTSSNSKRSVARPYRHRHVHGRAASFEKHRVHEHKKRDPQEVTATIDGEVVSWENNWFGPSSASSAAPVMVTATIDGEVTSWINNWSGSPQSTPSAVLEITATIDGPVVSWADTYDTWVAVTLSSVSSTSTSVMPLATGTSHAMIAAHAENIQEAAPSTPTPSMSPTKNTAVDGSSIFNRTAYYDSETQTVDNLVFLGNFGGQGSGVFDETFGASLAYSNGQGTGGAASPQILSDIVIPSASEVIVMLGQECQNGDCGFTRPGGVAYHGFAGADKVFLVEFIMPHETSDSFLADQPAFWLLNAQIPRTLQYGNPTCSCWETGCGEFDIAEALSSGSTYLKSTVHANHDGGNSDYFARPVTQSMKMAVVFQSSTSTVRLQVLPDDTVFNAAFTPAEIQELVDSSSDLSVFPIA